MVNNIELFTKQLDLSSTKVEESLAKNDFTWAYRDHLDLHEKISDLPLSESEKNMMKTSLDLSQFYIDKIKNTVAWFFQGIGDNAELNIFLFLSLKDLVSMKRVSKGLRQTMNWPDTRKCLLSPHIANLNAKITTPEELGITKEEHLINELGDHCESVKVLDLKGFSKELNLEMICSSFPNLESLALHDLEIGKERALNLMSMNSLENLTLKNCRTPFPDFENMGNSHILYAGAWGMRYFPNAPTLDCDYFQKLEALKTLRIVNNEPTNIIWWPISSSIEHIVIHSTYMEQYKHTQFRDMSFLKYFPSLKSLSLNHCSFVRNLQDKTDEDLQIGIKGICPLFETLQITNKRIGMANRLI